MLGLLFSFYVLPNLALVNDLFETPGVCEQTILGRKDRVRFSLCKILYRILDAWR